MEIHGGVYDLTTYARVHPGGARNVTDWCGTRATQPYSMFHERPLLTQVQSKEVGVLSVVETPYDTLKMSTRNIFDNAGYFYGSEDESEDDED
jgi:cytochrome b involved in lipid metabolism